MIRTINERTFLFLCQSSNWQCVIEAEDEESAATIAAEVIMKEDDKNISMFFAVKQLANNLFNAELDPEAKLFYAPIILANAGYYHEANKLEEILSLKKDENE